MVCWFLAVVSQVVKVSMSWTTACLVSYSYFVMEARSYSFLVVYLTKLSVS
jgi:hypothetical protein